MSVGRGWRPWVAVLRRLCRSAGVSVMDVKEKYGGLRFYVGDAPGWMHGLIEAVEEASFYVCEECGQEARCRTDLPWIKTLCEEHYEQVRRE